MIAWIMGNLATLIVGLILAVIFVLVVIYMINNKRKGRPSCGCECAGCPKKTGCGSDNYD